MITGSVCEYCWGKGCHLCGKELFQAVEEDICDLCTAGGICLGEIREQCERSAKK